IASPADVSEGDCPGEYEDRFEIENDEEHRHEIEFRRKPQMSRTDADNSGFEWLDGRLRFVPRSEEIRAAEHHRDQPDDGCGIQHQRPQRHRYPRQLPTRSLADNSCSEQAFPSAPSLPGLPMHHRERWGRAPRSQIGLLAAAERMEGRLTSRASAWVNTAPSHWPPFHAERSRHSL